MKEANKVFLKYCSRCLMPETRPRITFDNNQICNACTWSDEKKNIDWDMRWQALVELCDFHKKRNKGRFDCIIPVSGGKDSSYVSYMMREKLGMNPLCITIRPAMADDIGKINLNNFIEHGFNHIHITPDRVISKEIDKQSLITHGRPMQAWMISVQAAIFRCAVLFDIPLVMWGEDGETEYGGSSKLKDQISYDIQDSVKLYLSGVNPANFLKGIYPEEKIFWWTYPKESELLKLKPVMAHWSFFENWDPYSHYLLAKDKLGLQEKKERCNSTYNNFGQTDTNLYDLYTYFMYIKFGFGRTTQDVGIDIRRGAMRREQGLMLVKMYDGELPEQHIDNYLRYFDMTKEEFDSVIDEHVNKDLFIKINNKWHPLFEPV